MCVSVDTKRILVKHYNISEEKVMVIHNAVDTNKFYSLRKQQKQHIILYVGRLDKRKVVEFLIRSMPLVRQQISDALLLVGGKGSYLEKMKSLVRRLNLERNVTFRGFVPDDQLISLYNQAQCAVVPSIFEGFGMLLPRL